MNKYLILASALSLFSSTESMSSSLSKDDDVGNGPRAQSSKSTSVGAAAEESARNKSRQAEEDFKKKLETVKKLNEEKAAEYKIKEEETRKIKMQRDKEAAENERLRAELTKLQKQIREQERLSASVGQEERVRQQARARK